MPYLCLTPGNIVATPRFHKQCMILWQTTRCGMPAVEELNHIIVIGEIWHRPLMISLIGIVLRHCIRRNEMKWIIVDYIFRITLNGIILRVSLPSCDGISTWTYFHIYSWTISSFRNWRNYIEYCKRRCCMQYSSNDELYASLFSPERRPSKFHRTQNSHGGLLL